MSKIYSATPKGIEEKKNRSQERLFLRPLASIRERIFDSVKNPQGKRSAVQSLFDAKGYLDKVIEVDRKGKVTKFAYDGFGMLAQKTFVDGRTEVCAWDGLALIRRGSDIYFNEPHISGGVPVASKTEDGIRYHEHDFLGTTLCSMDTKGKIVKDYQDTTIFGEGSIQHDRSARFTGKPLRRRFASLCVPLPQL